jgi:hypothetical protein
MDFTPGTLVSLKVKISIGRPDYKAPSTNKTLKLTKVLSESDVYFNSPPELAQLSDAQPELNSLR